LVVKGTSYVPNAGFGREEPVRMGCYRLLHRFRRLLLLNSARTGYEVVVLSGQDFIEKLSLVQCD